jgi:hypothetical protein
MTQDNAPNMQKLATQAADAFAQGNIVGGIGIAGLSLLVAAIPLIERSAPPVYQSPHFYLGILAGVAGCTFIFTSGLLYREKIRTKKDLVLALATGYAEVSAQLASKVDQNAVAANRITEYSDTYWKSMVKLLEDK